ncbi:MAG: GxxExxY protein [Gemmatimonadota bacterium]
MGNFHEDDEINPLTGQVIGGAIAVHRALGPGLLEKTYETCLAAELRHVGLRVECQVPVPIVYRDVRVDCAYRIDVPVERELVVELKVAETLAPVHTSQVLTYLRLTGLHVGLLLNFNVRVLPAGGIRRVFWQR